MQTTRSLYVRFFSYVKPFWPVLVLGVFCNALSSSVDAGLTYMVKFFLDKGFINVDMAFVHQIPAMMFFAIVGRGLFGGLGGYCMAWVARHVVNVLRQKVFAHMMKLPASYYDGASSGELLSKILYNVEQVAQVSADALTDLVQNACLVVGMLTIMFWISWSLSLMFLFTIPCVALLVTYTNKRVRRMSHRVQATMGEVTSIASEAIDGYKVVRMFGTEHKEMLKFNQATECSRKNDMKVAVSKAVNVLGVQVIIAIAIATIVFVSIQMTSFIHVSAGSYVTIIAAMIQLVKPIKTLATLNVTFQRGLAGAESVFSLLDEPIESHEGLLLSQRVQGSLVFEKVSFGYRLLESVLHEVNFKIDAGKTLALVGHSGSGKTTISSLIPRFYDVISGQILLDGMPINDLSLQSLRQQIAIVSQHVTLFNDSIAENIAYGSNHASRAQIMQAAQFACADEFIQRLPQGYDTRIGDNGVLLSGGQRQRLAIARALLKDAPILILDEATSALDSESERLIQIALERVTKNRTTLVIAHRLSTIVLADSIVVLHQGRVVEAGTHEQLLAKKGHYSTFFHTQNDAFSNHREALVLH